MQLGRERGKFIALLLQYANLTLHHGRLAHEFIDLLVERAVLLSIAHAALLVSVFIASFSRQVMSIFEAG